MIQSTDSKIKYISKEHFKRTLERVKTPKYRCLFVLMYDAGLRSSEACSLQIGDVNFKESIIKVYNLKKRDIDSYRTIPMTSRLREELAIYYQNVSSRGQYDYWFEAGKKATKLEYYSPKTSWKRFKIFFPNARQHDCRHSFITNLVMSGVDIHVACELAGHSSITTTQIYVNIAMNHKRLAIDNLEPELTIFQRIAKRFQSLPQIEFSAEVGSVNFIVGREVEMMRLIEFSSKSINVLIVGSQGVGKSHLIENLKISHGNVIRFDEFGTVKKTLQMMILEILKDKQHLADRIFNEKPETYGKILDKKTIKYLTELLIEITEKHEYSLIIDDLDRIPPSGVKALEKLNNHFHIIGAARQIKIDKASFTTNFEIIRIENLKRVHALEMIDRLSYNLTTKIEDYEMYRNHIFEQTDGNPKFIFEMVERYDKETSVTVEVTRGVNHLTAIKEVDMSLPILIGLSSLMILRYFGRETGETSYQFIGAIFMMFALFGRSFFNSFKRKFV
jgi:integrase/recombinase XerD